MLENKDVYKLKTSYMGPYVIMQTCTTIMVALKMGSRGIIYNTFLYSGKCSRFVILYGY